MFDTEIMTFNKENQGIIVFPVMAQGGFLSTLFYFCILWEMEILSHYNKIRNFMDST